MKKDHLKADLIVGVTCGPQTEAKVRAQLNGQQPEQLVFQVFRLRLNGVAHYCCFSGGERGDWPDDGSDFVQLDSGGDQHWPKLTLIGQAAAESLGRLPVASDTLIFAELRRGPTPLRDKVIANLKRAGPNAKVCFFGDLSKELDGFMLDVFGSPDQVGMIDAQELLQ